MQSTFDKATQYRRTKLGAIAADPEAFGWPTGYFAEGRFARGERGVTLHQLAEALGCSWQTVRALAGEPIGLMTAPGKPGFGTYDPDLLIDLRSNPKVLASRERRSFTLSDRERVEAIQSYFNTAVGVFD